MTLRELDLGYTTGRVAGRVSVCERHDGTWDVVFVPMHNGTPQILKTFPTRARAIEWGFGEYAARRGWAVPLASDSGA